MKIFKQKTGLIILLCAAAITAGCGGGRGGSSKNTDYIASSKEGAPWKDETAIRETLAAGNFDAAERMAKKRLETAPADPAAYYLLAKSQLGKKDILQAVKNLENAVKLQPDNKSYKDELYNSMLELSEKQMSQGMFGDAFKNAKIVRAAGFAPENSDITAIKAAAGLAARQIAMKNDNDAEETLRDLSALTEGNPEAQSMLANFLAERDRIFEAERIIKTAYQQHPNNRLANETYALIATQKGDSAKAALLATQGLEKFPESEVFKKLTGQTGTAAPMVTLEPLEEKETLEDLEKNLAYYKTIGNDSMQLKTLEKIAAYYPEKQETYLALADVSDRMGLADKAGAAISKYLEQNPESQEGKLILVRTLYQKGEYDKATAIIEALENTYPNKNAILSEKAQIFARTGKFNEAKNIWADILKDDPGNSEVLFNYAQLEMESGHAREAGQYFKKAMVNNPFNNKYRYFAGLNMMQLGQKRQAMEMWNSARAVLNTEDPYSRRILAIIGEAPAEEETPFPQSSGQLIPSTSHANTLTETGTSYQQSGVVISPSSQRTGLADPYYEALQNARTGNFEAAIPLFREALLNNPQDLNALMNLGQVYTATGNRFAAAALYAKALKVEPKNIYALKFLANAYSEIGMHTYASEVTSKAVVIYPEELDNFPQYSQNAPIINESRSFAPLAEAMLQENMLEEASKIIVEGIKADSSNLSLYTLLGDFYSKTAQYSQAKKAYESVISRDPQNPRPYIRLADLYSAINNKKEAAKQLRAASQVNFLNPDTMFEIADKFAALGYAKDSLIMLNTLKTMNLTSKHVLMLDERLGTDTKKSLEEKEEAERALLEAAEAEKLLLEAAEAGQTLPDTADTAAKNL
ncbi:MAG: tetratricopeptide repeat protein [Candidatus Riflebacteria bacterium]|nr:tetratricopeptide repeat protein [Candidatus Riflebacteria bacterium]